MKVTWLDAPEEHDYPAALDYLTLVMSPDEARRHVDALRQAPMALRKVKDILRASGYTLLPETNRHVAHNITKVKAGRALSPILLVPGPRLVVADGYHRVCAAYHLGEDTPIPCKISDLGGGGGFVGAAGAV